MKTDEAGIVISGRSWSASDFVRADGTPGPWTSKALEADPLSFEAELGRFLTEFFSPGAAVTVHTSGSTGAPKAFAAEKSRMRSCHHRVFGAQTRLHQPAGYAASLHCRKNGGRTLC